MQSVTTELTDNGMSTDQLEDEIYLFIDKIIALCVVQQALDDSDYDLPLGIRSHYALVMEEQARELRKLLVARFE